MFSLFAALGAWTLEQILITAVIIAALIALMFVAIQKFEIAIPDWVLKVFWIVVVAFVVITAMRFVLSM